MKSIFKKIALVLVFAMVVTMLPAKSVAVSAADASANKWTRKTCTLYIDALEDDTIYVPAAYATAKTKVAVAKDAEDGWGTLGYKVSFESADPSIAAVGETRGLVEAVGIGQTTITATFTKKGAATVTESFPVTVKRAAASVALDEETEKAVNNLVVGNDPVVLKAIMTDADGNQELVEKTTAPGKLSVLLAEGRKYVTDYLKFEVKNPEDKEVLKYDAEKNELTAVAEGTATLNVVAYRYDWKATAKTKTKYAKTRTAVQSYPVTVKAAGIVSAKQVKYNTVAITCETEELAKTIAEKPETLKVVYILSDNKISETIKAVTVDGTDTKVINVELYNDMMKDTTYEFNYADGTPLKVVAVDPTNVVDIRLVNTQVVVETFTKLEAKYYDANGVEVRGENAKLSFYADPKNEYSLSVDEIFFFKTGAQAVIKMTYGMGYDLNTGAKLTDIVREGVVYSVGKDNGTGGVNAWAVRNSSETPTLKASSINNYSTDAIRLAVGDAEKQLYVRFDTIDSNGKSIHKYNLSADGSEMSDLYGNLYAHDYQSSNETILLVDSQGRLKPVKNGSAQIIVKRRNPDDTWSVVGVVSFTISDERKLALVNVTDGITSRISTASSADVKFEVKDQLGDDFKDKVNVTLLGVNIPAGVTVTAKKDDKTSITLNNTTPQPLAMATDGGKLKFTITANSTLTGVQNMQIEIKVTQTGTDNSITRRVSLAVKNVANAKVQNYRLEGSLAGSDVNFNAAPDWSKGTDETDGIDKIGGQWNWFYSTGFGLKAYDSEGYFIRDVPIDGVANADRTSYTKADQGKFYAEVLKNGTRISVDGSNVADISWDKKVQFTVAEQVIKTTSGSAVTGPAIWVKKDANVTGLYVIRVYEIKASGNRFIADLVGTAQVNVTDSSPAVIATANVNTLHATSAKESIIDELKANNILKFVRSGKDITNLLTVVDIAEGDYTLLGNRVYIRNIIVREDTGNFRGSFEYKVPVNMTFTLN